MSLILKCIVIVLPMIFIFLLFKKIRLKWNRLAKRCKIFPEIFPAPAVTKSFLVGLLVVGYVNVFSFKGFRLFGVIIILGIFFVTFSLKWSNKQRYCELCGHKIKK